MVKKVFHCFVVFFFACSLAISGPAGYSQPTTLQVVTSRFTPALLQGITLHPDNPLRFNFIIDPADTNLNQAELKAEGTKLIKYFLATLAIPEDDIWVNLSPYEQDQIISDEFAETEMGRDLLAQDYLLKRLTASLTYPEDKLGKKFWDKVYKRAYELYGTTKIPLSTFNKVWIVPEKAVVYEQGDSAFVVESHLKVMLEEDYLAYAQAKASNSHASSREASSLSSEVVREVLIPAIEQEVNQGQAFAKLRQVYNSMILATWYKKNMRKSVLGAVYFDQGKTKGVDLKDKQVIQRIYAQYVDTFKKGVYDFIKTDYDPQAQKNIKRKYFSGGTVGVKQVNLKVLLSPDELTAQQRDSLSGRSLDIVVDLRRPSAEAVIPVKPGLLSDKDVRVVPKLADSVAELVNNFKDLVTFDISNEGKITNAKITGGVEKLEGNRRLIELEREATINLNSDIRKMAFYMATAITNARGSKIISLSRPYADAAFRGALSATNMRSGGVLEAASFYQALKETNAVGISELAGSELLYSGLPDYYAFSAATQLGAAFAGYKGLIAIQVDHLQIVADKLFALDGVKAKAKGITKEQWSKMNYLEREESGLIDQATREKEHTRVEKIIDQAIDAQIPHIDLDNSTTVDPILLKKLYQDSKTQDNPKGLSRITLAVQKRIDRGENMDQIGDWLNTMSDKEFLSMYDERREKAYIPIQKFNAETTVRHIVRARVAEAEAKKKGLLPQEFRELLGGEERHIDFPELKELPSEPEGAVAYLRLVMEGLAKENEAFKAKYGYDLHGLDKLSYQTGTAHGVAGREINATVFLVSQRALKLKLNINIAGVQHGTSKNRGQFSILNKHGINEAHLATQLANTWHGTIVQESPVVASLTWDLLQLFLNPKDEYLTQRIQAYLGVIGKDSQWLMDYLKSIDGKIKKFRSADQGGKNIVEGKYLKVLAEEINLRPDSDANRQKITYFMVADPGEVPAKARSIVKDLIKYLYTPLHPYFTRMPAGLEDKVMQELVKWQVDAIKDLGTADNASDFNNYIPAQALPVPTVPTEYISKVQAGVRAQASVERAAAAPAHGGINLDAKLLDLEIRRDKGQLAYKPGSRAFKLSMQIEGLVPVIEDMTYVHLPFILGSDTIEP